MPRLFLTSMIWIQYPIMHWEQQKVKKKKPSLSWLRKACSCLYKISQLTLHIRTKTKPWGERNCLQSSDRIVSRHRSGEGYKTISAAQMPPQFLNGKCGKTRSRARTRGLQGLRWNVVVSSIHRARRCRKHQPSLQHSTNFDVKAEGASPQHKLAESTLGTFRL